MAQFDVYTNTNTETAQLFPYLLNIQHDLLSTLKTRVVVPLCSDQIPITHLNPTFIIEDMTVFMSTGDMAGIPLSTCGEIVGNLEEKRSEIINALDFLVSGF
jgi:toxin CcdB